MAPHPAPRVLIVADDLIWASRLTAAAQRAGLRPVPVPDQAALELQVGEGPVPAGAVIDLGGHRYDGVAAVTRAAAAGLRVLAVSQHDDLPLRKRALAAGARRVLSYNKMHADGPDVLRRWLDGS
ncbi:MAG TPA: hypothetical protein VFW92_10955 [Candidatus Limnocylindrales bacterium]|nr:hypothetical protein [Candidatus Limnocylindrales bacterium]